VVKEKFASELLLKRQKYFSRRGAGAQRKANAIAYNRIDLRSNSRKHKIQQIVLETRVRRYGGSFKSDKVRDRI
jgi:hypothetical protein